MSRSVSVSSIALYIKAIKALWIPRLRHTALIRAFTSGGINAATLTKVSGSCDLYGDCSMVLTNYKATAFGENIHQWMLVKDNGRIVLIGEVADIHYDRAKYILVRNENTQAH